MLAAAIIAALVTSQITPYVRTWAEKKGLIDQPDSRRINQEPMPRAGGIAIFLGFLAASIITISLRQISSGKQDWTLPMAGALISVTLAALLGLADDIYDLSAGKQAMALALIGLTLYLFGVRIEGVSNPLQTAFGAHYNPTLNWHALSPAVAILFTIIWVFTVIKTVDAIDGVDGLAAGVCAISAATLALMATQLHSNDGPGILPYDGPTLALLAASIVGACLGFLRHNYHPARIIMGTVGAWSLGAALAAVSILGAFKVAAAVSVLVPVLVLGVPIFDYIHVVTSRLMARAPLTKADKRHLHHLLLDRGWSQRQVTLFIYTLELALCVMAFVIFQITRAH